MTMGEIKVAVSGYFNPLHSGHIDFLKYAKKLGTHLTVIVNNDVQVKLKGSVPFMDERERVEILKAIKYVDNVILSIDTDTTVCETLRRLKPDKFANGGDRLNDNVPEIDVCKKYRIITVFGVGSDKIQSSSSLINKANKYAKN